VRGLRRLPELITAFSIPDGNSLIRYKETTMRTTKTILLLISALAVLVGGGAILADEGMKDHGDHHGKMTVRGEILDMACYVSHEAKGPDHAACAKRCVKGGQPMGLLAEDGTVYLLYASHDDASAFEQAKEHAGTKVEITGVGATQAGIKGIEVHGVKPL
jgi:hypothetical protein